LDNYICIHAHFYQPPRENPWLESIEYQESAYPYHDWNQRITAECYQPNAVSRILDEKNRIAQIVNNYSSISFNFGPTLLSWLEWADPETYKAIVEADKESQERFSGHGSAIAQGYNHAILPLCNERDRITQISWGILDFEHRFGRKPESLWLPETAVDLETLDLMAQMGLKFAILAPSQAKRVRKRGERNWRNVSNQNIDPSMAYEIRLPTGRRMALFFYDGPISRAVGFEKLLSNGEAFVNRLMSAFSAERKWPQLVHIASDGETYGHHHHYGEMALAYALNSIGKGTRARLTNYGEYLEKHPPTHMVEIWENSSWSCVHGIGRWQENCGCHSGMHPGWHQQWRAPLRKALDWLRDSLENLFDDAAMELVHDPWAARNDYINAILNRSQGSVNRFIARHSTHELNDGERVKLLKLMELQRHAMLMYTSCGWFFDEISGIETVQILQYAGRAIQLSEELFGRDNIEESFLDLLQNAPSNIPNYANGRNIYDKFVKSAMVDRQKVVGHYAVSSLFHDYPKKSEIYSYFVDREYTQALNSGKSRLVTGRCKITSKITSESETLEYGVLQSGDHKITGGVRQFESGKDDRPKIDEITDAFEKDDLPGAYWQIDECFGKSLFSLKSLFRDEQRRVLDVILKATNADLEELNEQAFERTAPLMRFLMDLGLPLPPLFRNIATAVINFRLQNAFKAKDLNSDYILDGINNAKFWGIDLDAEGLAYVFRKTIENLAREFRSHRQDLPSLEKLISAVRLALQVPFSVSFYRTQNIYYDMLKTSSSEMHKASEKGEAKAKAWVQKFKELGSMLSIKVE
jgi:alpha-amylase/alpha-mannosidase (GH57 family)